MSSQPVQNLELRAMEQRNRLHQTTSELKAKLSATREQLDVPRQIRRHYRPVALAVAAIALLAGLGVGGMLTRR
jgi:hypothetical protein